MALTYAQLGHWTHWPTFGLKLGHSHQREHQGAGTQLSPAARGWL